MYANATTHHKVLNDILAVYLQIITVVGITGNIMSIFVFMCTNLRKLPSSHYLTALAIADSGVLLLTALNNHGIAAQSGYPIVCQISYYAYYVWTFLSVWLVVSFTVERFIVVCFPLKRFEMCTITRARGVIVGLAMLAIVSYSYCFFVIDLIIYNGTNTMGCGLNQDHKDAAVLANIIDTVVTLGLPTITIIFFNCIIAHKLIRQYPQVFKREKSFDSLARSKSDESITNLPLGSRILRYAMEVIATTLLPVFTGERSKRRQAVTEELRFHRHPSRLHKREQRLTKMLLIISVVFVLMNLPDHIVRLYIHFNSPDPNKPPTDTLEIAQKVTNTVFNSNFAINFFLYSIVGANFRQHFKTLMFRVINILTWKKFPTIKARSNSHVMVTYGLNHNSPNRLGTPQLLTPMSSRPLQ